MKRALILATLAALMIDRAQAYTETGMGTSSCGSWTTNLNHRDRQWDHLLDLSWVLGFLSGAGYAGNSDIDPLHGVDGYGVEAWISNWCQTHPIEHISHAARAFIAAHPH